MNIIEIVEILQKLNSFVRITCKDRDDSHGFEHMSQVTQNAIKILQNENITNKNIIIKTIIVAMLHDVADHKYDKDGTLHKRVESFIAIISNEKYIMKIIDYISYSKEQRAIDNKTPIDYENELGYENAIVRHIVSDADKLEALGHIGFERCKEYNKHINKDISESDLEKLMVLHADEKLLRLKDHFMRTNSGKLMAEKLHNELANEINLIRK
jgi:HD superfamily phosphodiesterase